MPMRVIAAVGAWMVLFAGCTSPDAASTPTQSVQVRIDSMDVHGVNPSALSILIYADGPASVKFGTEPPHLLVDTVRLRSAPSFTLDVSKGAVHVEFVDGQLDGGGVLMLAGHVIGQDSIRLRAVGRHLLAEQGGTGIRVIDRGNPRLMK
ncbi:hypothetical protein HKW67_19115 [Gemmatimonas groenlandica]|uniref:Auto-transporter adhesin head GIN domain-containing protein n=2 Tax=Gemmatimonas groenlandica TaxID=2732249 RepID=A0A6M4IZ06_9BACT|nr:hypothetical protein HKW67_19115 [Gemmatimonas groenlandica]